VTSLRPSRVGGEPRIWGVQASPSDTIYRRPNSEPKWGQGGQSRQLTRQTLRIRSHLRCPGRFRGMLATTAHAMIRALSQCGGPRIQRASPRESAAGWCPVPMMPKHQAHEQSRLAPRPDHSHFPHAGGSRSRSARDARAWIAPSRSAPAPNPQIPARFPAPPAHRLRAVLPACPSHVPGAQHSRTFGLSFPLKYGMHLL
jgi:hypothetical protein